MGFNEGTDCNTAQERAWGQDAIPEHRIVADWLANVVTEDDCGDAQDQLIDAIVDDTSDLRDWVKLAVSAKDDAELGRLMRQYATQKAYRVARAAQ